MNDFLKNVFNQVRIYNVLITVCMCVGNSNKWCLFIYLEAL